MVFFKKLSILKQPRKNRELIFLFCREKGGGDVGVSPILSPIQNPIPNNKRNGVFFLLDKNRKGGGKNCLQTPLPHQTIFWAKRREGERAYVFNFF